MVYLLPVSNLHLPKQANHANKERMYSWRPSLGIDLQERMCKGEFFLEQSPANTLEELWDGEI